MVSAGRVLIIPKGDYSAEASYEMLDLVSYNGSSYIAKKPTTGNLPTNTTYWQLNAYGGSAANLAGNFATLETTDYASKDYAVDDFLVTKDSQFCKVIDSITTGDELVLDTNIEATDVGELIQAVIAYADGLDAKNVKLNGAVAITSQTDLDDMTTIGNYYKSSTSFYVTNAPTGIASELTAIFRLTVENGSDTTNKYIQTLRTNDGKTYTRAYNGSAWSDWVEFASAASVSAVNAEVTKVKTIIAPIEDGATASQAYTVGEQFIKSGVLYKAKTDIDLGDTLTLNTNYELSDDVVAQIAAVNQTLTNETYNVNDTAITEVASDDLLPIYDTSTTGKKKIAVSNFISGLVSNRNLVDNPWFTVNQRGFTSGSAVGSFTVDRWLISHNPDLENITFNDGVITITGSNANTCYLSQNIEYDLSKLLLGKKVTLSALLSDGSIYSTTKTVPTSFNDTTLTEDFGNFRLSIGALSGVNYCRFNIASNIGKSVSFRAVKLELGSVSTLAMDTAPNYATELLKCQRYFIMFADGTSARALGIGQAKSATIVNVHCTLPVKMRANPNIETNDITKCQLRNGESYLNISNAARDAIGTSDVIISFTTSGATVGACYEAFVNINGMLGLTADL